MKNASNYEYDRSVLIDALNLASEENSLYQLLWQLKAGPVETRVITAKELAQQLLAEGFVEVGSSNWMTLDPISILTPTEAGAVLQDDKSWEPPLNGERTISLELTNKGKEELRRLISESRTKN